MKKKLSRIVPLFLSLAMLMSLLCVQASAASAELHNDNGNADLIIADATNQRTVTSTFDGVAGESLNAYDVPVGATISLTVGGTRDLSCSTLPYTLDGDTVTPVIDGQSVSLPGGTLGTSATFEVTTAGVYLTTVTGDGYAYFTFILNVTGDAAADADASADATDTTPAETPADTTPAETTGTTSTETTSTETTVNPFTDVAETSPYRDAILWAVEKNITKGTTDTTFAPTNTCTNNHILTFLWRANGSPAATIENPFDNIDVNGDFGKAALWAAEQKLVDGTSFPGTDACTRSTTVTYLWKLAGSPETAVSDKFTDVAADADYAQAVAWAVAQGITQGTGDGTTFSPDTICNRGQIVTFLYRAQQAAQTAETTPEA